MEIRQDAVNFFGNRIPAQYGAVIAAVSIVGVGVDLVASNARAHLVAEKYLANLVANVNRAHLKVEKDV